MAYLQLPNGKYLKIPEGMSPDQAYASALEKFPNLLEEPEQRKGFGAAVGKGTESVLSSLQTGLESIVSPEKAAKKGLARQQELGEKYAEQIGTEKLREAYEKSGLIGAGGELLRQVPLAIGEQLPNLATMYAGAKLGARAPIPGVYGKLIGAGLGALAPSALQQFGSNIERQAAEQVEAGQPVSISRGKAAAAAAPQAALDVAASFIPLGGKVAGKVFGPEVEKLLMRGGTEAAEKLAKESFAKTLGKGLAVGAAAEIPTEITQQMLERAQAGLSLTSPDALKEYGETAYQVGLLAPIGGAGRFIDKSSARAGIKQRELAEEQRLAEEQAKVAEEEKLNKEAMEEMAKIAAENKPTFALSEQQLEEMRADIGTQRFKFNKELDDLRAQAQKETDIDKLVDISSRAEKIQSAIEEMSPGFIKRKIQDTSQQIKAANKELKAAEKDKDDAKITDLQTQLTTLNDSLEDMKAKLPAYEEAPAVVPPKQISERIAAKMKQVNKARDLGDLGALAKLTREVKELQRQYTGMQMPAGPATQGDLFETGKEGFIYPEDARQKQIEQKAKQEEDFQKALEEATKRTTPKATEVVEAATEKDIEAQRKLQKLRKEREQLEELFNQANENNDIRAAYDLRNTVIPQKEAEIAKAEQAAKGAPPTEYGLAKVDTVKEAREIASLKDKIKSLDDQLKKAAAGKKPLEKDGELTDEGKRLADVQLERDNLLAQVQRRETNLSKINLQQGVEAQLTDQISRAFPQQGPQAAFIGKTGALRRHIGNRLGLRANLMGLQRKLQLARRKRQDREAATSLINQMRSLLERLNAFESESIEIPIPKELPEKTKQYYTKLNETRQAQQRATDVYLGSLQSLARRDYIGGATKRAKATKQVLEKRVDDNAKRLTASFFDEIDLHRVVTGKVRLNDKQKEKYNEQFAETFADFKRLAEGELAATESAQAVLAEQITNIIQDASNEAIIRAEKPLLRTQFAPKKTGTFTDVEGIEKPTYAIEKEEPPKDTGITPREREEGKKLDISNIGQLATAEEKAALEKTEKEKRYPIDQRELFGERELEPIATKRATHKNFMRFVAIQGGRFKAAQEALEKIIKATETPRKTLEQRINDYRKKVGEYKRLLNNVLEETKTEARQRAQAEVKARSRQLRKEALAISEQLYGAQLKTLETNLRTMQKEQKEFVRLVNKMKDGKLKNAALKQIKDKNEEIESLQNSVNAIYKNFEDAVELAPITEEEKLFKQYVEADPVLKSVKASMQRKRATLDKMMSEFEQNLEKTGRERRAAQAIAEPPAIISPAEVEAEQRLLSGLNLPGVRISGNIVAERAKLAELKQKLTGYIKAGNKKSATETRAAIAEQQKVVDEIAKPLLTPEEAAKKREAEVSELSRRSTEYSKERAELKQRQAEMRRKEGIEFAQKKREQINQEIAELQDKLKEAPTKDEKDVLAKEIAAKQKQLKAVKAVPTEERIPPSKRQVGPATRDVSPPQLKTGVARGPAKKAIEAGIKRGAKAFEDIDVASESRESGISADNFRELFRDIMNNDVDYRIEDTRPSGAVSKADVEKELGKIKMPKGLQIVVMEKMSPIMAGYIVSRNLVPTNIKGGVLGSGKVFIVAAHHKDLNDLKKTIAHELIGHAGVEGILGKGGMEALAKKVIAQEGGVIALAEKLGVRDDAMGAYMAAIKSGETEQEAQTQALRELIAHTAETTPTKSFLQKANDFIKAMVGAVRAFLRKMGLDLDISTSDVYKLIRDARKNFDSITPGAYVEGDKISFRSAPAVANPGFENALKYTKGIVAEQKGFLDRIKGEATGMIFETKYVDRFAPLAAVAERMKDSLQATQMMYYLRMHDQRMAFTGEVASNGPLDLVKAKDGKGVLVESTKGASLADMAKALGKARVGNEQATIRVFTLWMAAQRAKTVGLNKLNFSGKITQQMLDEVERNVAVDRQTAAAFKEASDIYAKYNEGLINFAVKTGAIAKKDADNMLKNKNFIPFYRERPNTKEVFLEIGGAPAIKIGNLTQQPYLHELIGGDDAIFDIFTSALQNTTMLTDMALRNLSTKNVANSLASVGMLKTSESAKDNGIHKGDGPTGPNIIRFKSDGENYWAEVDTKTTDIPSELLVKGMEGVNTALPNVVQMMNAPANLLRKWVTRNPAYTLRQLIRDPLNAVMVAGLDTVPVASSVKEIAKMWRGTNEGEFLLQRRGILGGQVLTGTTEDQKKILNDILSGKKGWDYRMAQLDKIAIQGDAATRIVMYNNYIKQGLSEMEATLATLESMNFSKRGISPSLFALSTMVPFMNAQIQGLNVMYKAFTGKMPFSEKLKVKQKLMQRAMMMAAFSFIYASMMQDDEAYQNANDDEKYSNWFVPNPFGEGHIKIPIPFEMGLVFKAFPEALYNTVFGDEKLRDTASAIGKLAWNAIPISGPQGVKPALEVFINYSFYTGRDIESPRLQQLEPSERYTERTSEIAKLVGGVLGNIPGIGEYLSPVKIEYLVRGYTGSVPLAVASLANPILRGGETGEQPDTRSFIGAETPLIGSFFQPKDATGLINKAYRDMDDIIKAKETYKKMIEDGREDDAEKYLDANADVIGMASLAGKFRQQMGELTKQERMVRSDNSLTGKEKREQLDEIRQAKIELSKMLSGRE